MRKIYPLLLAVLWLSANHLMAQTSIKEYRDRVIEYSYTLKEGSANIAYLIETHGVAKTDFYPSLTLSGEFTRDVKRTEGQKSWDFGVQPQISQTVFNGGGVRAQIDKAAMNVEIGRLDAAYDRLEVGYTADYYYYYLTAMGSLRDVVDQYVEIITKLKDVVELRYNEGYIGKSDLLMIETRLSEALYQQIAMGEDYTIALQKFNVLQGFLADFPATLLEVNPEQVPLPARATLEEMLVRRPDFRAKLFGEQAAQESVTIAQATYNPTLTAGVAGLWRADMPNISGSTVMDGAFFVRLSAPLFHFSERRRSVGAAYALCATAELKTKALIDEIRLEESNMWATIIDSRAQLIAARRALEKGSENLDISTYSYSEGLTSILDVMQAQITWLQLYSNSIWSEFTFLVSISAYKRITASA